MRTAMKAVSLVVLCALILAVPSVWASWVQDGVAFCTTTGDHNNPQIVSDGAGGAIVTWSDQHSGPTEVYAQRVNASGTVLWTTDGVTLCAARGAQTNPAIVSDGAGGAIVTWMDILREVNGYDPDIYAQRVNASGSVQWMANGVALCTATGTQTLPRITLDGAGGAIVTWYDYRSGGYSDIYAQRVNASGSVQWMANGAALCTAAWGQVAPTITSDGVGGAIVTWYDFRNGSSDDIYAQRVNASGAVQWTPNGVALCTAPGDKRYPMIASDGAGGAIVTWYDYRSGGYSDIYAQRVNASGAAQWTANGVALCATTGEQSYPTITSDGAGGAIVTWWDYRSGNYDIYAQRVNASGSVQWMANGVALCTATGNQGEATIVSDGAGGAIVAWTDLRGGSYSDIYAQRVNASGNVRWVTDGVALCRAALTQEFPEIASDGAGGAIVTWEDIRSGTESDIYGMRVDASGFGVVVATDAPAGPVELNQNYPNPFNPTTTVTYSVPGKCAVKLEIYDVSGKCIACLVDRHEEKGSHAVEWNGKDAKGNSVASGIYLYRLAAGNQTSTKKMVLLR